MSESFAEPNAINITIKNASSGEILYQKIFPIDSGKFNDYLIKNGVVINITYDPDSPGSIGYTINKTHVSVDFGPGNYGIHVSSWGKELIINSITYDFNSSSSSTSSSAKAPIPLGVYLVITAFFTYILYRKSKNLT